MTDSEKDEKKKELFEALEHVREAFKELEEDQQEIVDKLDDVTKIAVTRWVFKHVVDHANEGGSFRYLIYDRLGFGMEAYVPLCGDGMTISNDFDIANMNKIKEVVREHELEVLKPLLRMCDEPGCYKAASCGWPAGENKYRMTCHEHMKHDMKKGP
jgi:hypothetical protein